MEIESLTQFIKKILEYYDEQNNEYKNLIFNKDNSINKDEITFNLDNKKIIKDLELLGYFDNQTNIWIWGWVIGNTTMEQTNICRNLLDYGLKLEPGTNTIEHFMIKSILVNSRIQFDEAVQLEVTLALCSYLVNKKILFIYPNKIFLDENKTKFATFYYLIK